MAAVTILVEAAVMAVDQATVVKWTKALTAARHLRTHMVEDHVHQTTWTTKFPFLSTIIILNKQKGR